MYFNVSLLAEFSLNVEAAHMSSLCLTVADELKEGSKVVADAPKPGTGLTYNVEMLPDALDTHSQSSSHGVKRFKFSGINGPSDVEDDGDDSVMSDA